MELLEFRNSLEPGLVTATFPLEIYEEIVSHLDRAGLENWSVCSRVCCDQASRRLWKTFHICPELFGDNLHAACDAILRLPYRARHIRTLIISPTSEHFRASLHHPWRRQTVQYQFPPFHLKKYTWYKLTQACKSLENLEHLVIERAHEPTSGDHVLDPWSKLDAALVRGNLFFPSLVAFSTETTFSTSTKRFCENHPTIRRLEIRTRDIRVNFESNLLPNLQALRAQEKTLNMLVPTRCISEIILDADEVRAPELAIRDMSALRDLLHGSATRTLRLPTVRFSSSITLSSTLARLSSSHITTLEFAWDAWMASVSGYSVFSSRVVEVLLQWKNLRKLECHYHWIDGVVRDVTTATTIADVRDWGIQNTSILDVTFGHANIRGAVLGFVHFHRKNVHAEWQQV